MTEPHMPQAAEIAPDFELLDSTGERQRLSSLLARHAGLVLIFYRGYW
jgi:peroxiredoxin